LENKPAGSIVLDTARRSLRNAVAASLVDYTYNHFIILLRHERGEIASGEAQELLKDWLIQHIMKTDKAYVPFLQSKGMGLRSRH